jgi:hypothetical protein
MKMDTHKAKLEAYNAAAEKALSDAGSILAAKKEGPGGPEPLSAMQPMASMELMAGASSMDDLDTDLEL